ncbi:MAG: S8 family serine peptidase [Deltaproteobacteria bacterium]|nr:S8 family serine peptidase [Deltaproteobacteria bacterium]
MKCQDIVRLFFVSACFCLISSGVWAQQGGSPFATPPGLGHAQPCLDPEKMPSQAKVPCAGILLFSESTSKQDRAAFTKKQGVFLRYNYSLVSATAILVEDTKSLAELARSKEVKLIPDRAVNYLAKPDRPPGKGKKDPPASGQITPSGVARIGSEPGKLSVNGAGVGVAVLDTGLDSEHGDLLASGSCFTAFASCQDGDGHGTHVGGIIAALDNTQDTVGVAPGSTPYAVKVLDDSGSGSDSTIMAGLEWTALNANSVSPKIKVANMSLGRPGTLDDNPALRAMVQAVKDQGIAIIVAAGNDARLEITQRVPASYPEVMAVASTTAEDGSNNRCRVFSGTILADTASYFTTDGAGVTISAPGNRAENISRSCHVRSEGILSLKAGGGTTRLSGTSMSAPHVAGVAALMIEKAGGTLDPELARSIIKLTADRLGTAPLDSPVSSYTFDGEHEGTVSACRALNESC